MHSAAAIRRQIEAALEARIPSALTPRPRSIREQSPTGIPAIDTLLEGGLPVGAITELVGSMSSGRTTLAQAALATVTAAGKAVAWIDASDALDPQSAAAAGVDLSRQLWVRCGGDSRARTAPQTSSSVTAEASLRGTVSLESRRTPASSGGCGSPHPRGEARGLDAAVEAIFQPALRNAVPTARGGEGRNPQANAPAQRRARWIGTPGAPNLKLTDAESAFERNPKGVPQRASDREEQVATDRLPPRRGANLKLPDRAPRSVSAAQIAYTGLVAGAWNDNRNNAAGRGLQTSPQAIAASLPRFSSAAKAASHGPAATDILSAGEPSEHNRSSSSKEAAGQVLANQLAGSSRVVVTAAKPTDQTSLAGDPPPRLGRSASPIWKALEQALRVTDLLLAAGGFAAIVLDLGSTPAEFAWRIPLATWFRFRAGAERSRAVLLVLTQHPCTRSSAELVLRLAPGQPQALPTVLMGGAFQVTVDRQRFEQAPPPAAGDCSTTEPSGVTLDRLHLVPRKPPQRARTAFWQRDAAWTRGAQ